MVLGTQVVIFQSRASRMRIVKFHSQRSVTLISASSTLVVVNPMVNPIFVSRKPIEKWFQSKYGLKANLLLAAASV